MLGHVHRSRRWRGWAQVCRVKRQWLFNRLVDLLLHEVLRRSAWKRSKKELSPSRQHLTELVAGDAVLHFKPEAQEIRRQKPPRGSLKVTGPLSDSSSSRAALSPSLKGTTSSFVPWHRSTGSRALLAEMSTSPPGLSKPKTQARVIQNLWKNAGNDGKTIKITHAARPSGPWVAEEARQGDGSTQSRVREAQGGPEG